MSRILAECFPTHIAALTRIGLLEIELENAATELQKSHPIGAVKAIGLREVAAASRDVCTELARVREERDRLRRDIEAWLKRHLDSGVKPRGYADPSGHPHGYSVVEIPDWEVRRKLDDLAALDATPAASGGGGEHAD